MSKFFGSSLIQKVEFARHIPTSQILRRSYLSLKRRLLDRCSPSLLRPWRGPELEPIQAIGVHAPHGEVWRVGSHWFARFLGEKRELGSDINWSISGGDPADQLWRMNLHYFEYLPDLSTADAIELIDNWITFCRPRTPGASSAAWQPYTISLRISSWLEALSTRQSFGDKDFRSKLFASLKEQADYLSENLETDLRGNHLIKNLRALTEVGFALNQPQHNYSKIIDKLLPRELNHQILGDGVHYERSPSYHMQVFADLLSIYANRNNNDAIKEQLKDTLHQMAKAASDLTHPDGYPAQFGDSGLTMTALAAECLQAFSYLFGSVPTKSKIFAFPEAGFYGSRSDDDYFIARMGALGPDALMAHAHGDWGSFEWSLSGQRVFVDQGVFRYSEGRTRTQSRSTAFHNTAMLDDAEQADFFGAFRCGVRPSTALPQFLSTPNGFELTGELQPAMHTGGGKQLRRISMSERFLRIEDTVISGRSLSARFLLHPAISVQRHGELISLHSSNGLHCTFSVEGGTLDVVPAVWWPDMGREELTTRIVVTGHSRLVIDVTVI